MVMLFHGARMTMRTASGSNHQLNSRRPSTPVIPPLSAYMPLPISTKDFASVATCGSRRNASAMLVSGPPVLFQDVVHSIGTREADCDEQSSFRGQIEWTSTRMPDSLCAVERVWSKP